MKYKLTSDGTTCQLAAQITQTLSLLIPKWEVGNQVNMSVRFSFYEDLSLLMNEPCKFIEICL